MQVVVRALAIVFLAALPSAAPGDVRVVAADGSGDFTSIQPAVDAAAAGDTLLVKGGSYDGFIVSGKDLVIAAEVGGTPTVDGKVTVSGIGAGKTLVLDGLRVAPVAGRAFEASACAGTVWIEDCIVTGGDGSISIPFEDCAGIVLQQCAAVVVVRTVAAGGDSFALLPNGLHGTDSEIHAYDSSFIGHPHLPGGRGASLDGGFLFASGTLFRGGDGPDGSSGPWGPCDGGDGGHALELESCTADTMDCTFLPGQGGTGVVGCLDGADGQDVATLGATHTTIAGFARSFEVDSPVRESSSAVLRYVGQPGDFVVALFGLTVQPVYFPSLRGTLLPSFPPGLLTLGTAAAGTLTSSVPIGPLPIGLESFVVPLQGGVVTSTGALVLAAGSTLVLLDGAF